MAEEDTTPFDNNLFSNHFLEERLNSLEEWRQQEIEEELSNQTNTEFYPVAHPFYRDHHNRESSAWNAAYRILDYEGELDVESGVASENSGSLSDYRFEPEIENLPNRRQDFLNLLNNLVRSAEVN